MTKKQHKRKSPSRRASRKSLTLQEAPEQDAWRESAAVMIGSAGVFLFLALFSRLVALDSSELVGSSASNLMGLVGERMSGLLVKLLGWCSFAIVLWTMLFARVVWQGGFKESKGTFWSLFNAGLGMLALLLSSACAAAVFWGHEGGGILGSMIAYTLVQYVNEAGTLLISCSIFLVALGAGAGLPASTLGKLLGAGGKSLVDAGKDSQRVLIILGRSMKWLVKKTFSRPRKEIAHSENNSGVPDNLRVLPSRKTKDNFLSATENFVLGDDELDKKQKLREKPKIQRTAGKLKEKKGEASHNKPKRAGNFSFPPLDLLLAGKAEKCAGINDEELVKNSERLEQALRDFRISGRIVEVQPGPVVTLYEFLPPAGVKVQRITSLADDLALALKVASVRVFAPVPGKGTVGIEVPNASRELVRLRDLLDSSEYQKSEAPLLLTLGKDTLGAPATADLSKMPHLLIAGATGTGKSVCINSMLLSLLYRNTPEQLGLILIDPKMLELSVYEDIPHLKAPVVTQPKRAKGVLWWAVEEMDRRYQLMKDSGVRNLAGYNRYLEEKQQDDSQNVAQADADLPEVQSAAELLKLPHVVIVVDELADLMLTVGREIEELITRLAQKARAAGIHLILATQRPSVNVITGLIKANFPARLSFQVASRIDSRTVLDSSGAERLLGRGDLLFQPPGIGQLKRYHAPFVSDKEVREVVAFLKSQGEANFDPGIERIVKQIEDREGDKNPGEDGETDADYDEFYDQAVALVVEKGVASTSMVQRAFRIGYNRAARILDTMEKEGVVGPADGSRPRDVLIPNREAMG